MFGNQIRSEWRRQPGRSASRVHHRQRPGIAASERTASSPRNRREYRRWLFFINSTVAPPTVKIIVRLATATANFNDTRPEASFINVSPCKMPMIFSGCALRQRSRRAPQHRSEKHRRQRKGRDQRNARHHPVNRKPMPTTVTTTSASARPENLSTMFEKFTGRRFPAISEQQQAG